VKNFYIFFSVLILLVSLAVLNLKGYFSIRYFLVPGRQDVEDFLNYKYSGKISFVYLEKELLDSNVKKEFSDIDRLVLKRNFNLTVLVSLVEKRPFAKSTRDNIYVSEDGHVFFSSKDFQDKLPVFMYPGDLNSKVLSNDEISFIKGITGYSDFEIDTSISQDIGLRSEEGILIKVKREGVNFLNMQKPLNKILDEINSGKKPKGEIIVLNGKIVLGR